MSTTGTRSAICVGETMTQLTPQSPDRLSTAGSMTMRAAGAESTVAMYLARLGIPTKWVSRIGADPFGRRIIDMMLDCGVDVDHVTEDPHKPTGLYFKDPEDGRTTVYYYRAGSAAASLAASDFPWTLLSPSTVVHTTGITAALSATTEQLVRQLLSTRATSHHIVSFDINYREALWRDKQSAASTLLDLATHSDIVFVGLDEAELLWGVKNDTEVRNLFPDISELVVKNADIGAATFDDAGRTFQPAEIVDVVEPVGAGDSFAAGYLYQTIHGASIPVRLRYGHHLAAKALQTTSDFVDPRE